MGKVFGSIGVLSVVVTLIAGWITNIVWVLSVADQGITARFVLGLVGVFVAPLGGIHGITLWF